MKNELFDNVVQIADTLSDESAKSRLLGVVANEFAKRNQFDNALQTLRTIPSAYERRIVLLGWNWKEFPVDCVVPLTEIIESHTKTKMLSGLLASTMLDADNAAAALKLIENVKYPFESEKQRFDFLKKYLSIAPQQTQTMDAPTAHKLIAAFQDETYQLWGRVIFAKKLAALQQYHDAEKIADSFDDILIRSWCYHELHQTMTQKNPQTMIWLEMSGKLLNEHSSTPNKPDELERFAIQLRITGKTCYRNGLKELGEQLLERCENIVLAIRFPLERFRLQIFLAKVMLDLKLIDNPAMYLPVDKMLSEKLTGIEQSRLLVWLAELSGRNLSYWLSAVEAANRNEKGTTETERAERIAEIIQHYAALQSEEREQTGEESETEYFTALRQPDCGC